MNSRAALSRIFAGMLADVDDYVHLRELLVQQFDAALHHRTGDIRAIGERISELAAILDGRRRERMLLARLLIVDPSVRASVAAVTRRLRGEARARFDSCWASLEALVRECKALNQRNCRLLMDQHDIMRRVLDRDMDTYAPA